MRQRLVERLLWFDSLVEGRRIKLLISAAILQVGFAPYWDQSIRHQSSVEEKASVLLPVTCISTLLFLFVSGLIISARVASLTLDDEHPRILEKLSLGRTFAWITTTFRRYVRLAKQSKGEVFVKFALGLCVVLMALRGTLGLFRWCSWKTLNAIFGKPTAKDGFVHGLRQLLTGIYDAEQLMQTLIALALLVVAVAAFVIYVVPDPLPTRSLAGLRSISSLHGIEPLILRRDGTKIAEVGGAFQSMLVQQVLHHLSEWVPSRSLDSENECRDDIAFFLRERRHQVATEFWISRMGSEQGGQRIDLLVDGCIAIELKHELHRKNVSELKRARGQIEGYANTWGEKGPVMLFLAETPSAVIRNFTPDAEKWNAELTRQKAPILLVADP